MTSEHEAYVWVWLPDATEPVVAGRAYADGDLVGFHYGRSYLDRSGAISLYEPELPLQRGAIAPPAGLRIAGCLDDAAPDAWGQHVIMRRLLGTTSGDADPADLHPLTYLLTSGSDRIGALDFQASPTEYVPRLQASATLGELMHAADLVQERLPLTPALDEALLHGSSVGGARPKVLLDSDERKFIAKFSARTDPYQVVKGEFVAMELARRAGLHAAPVALERVLDRDVLLIERFDRASAGADGWRRRMVVSALTMLQLHELIARHGSYVQLAEVIRAHFTEPRATLRELFVRIAFNILVGNTDDHARNHAAFWDGTMLTLTPAYDICPQLRPGREANQAMAYGAAGQRASQLAPLIDAAGVYQLSSSEAGVIVDHLRGLIDGEWNDVCDLAALSQVDRDYFRGRQFLNPYALEGSGG